MVLMKFFETPEFKVLNAQWREKLARKNSGFDDLEDADGNMTPLTRELNRDPRVDKATDFEERLDFFLNLDAWLATRPKICPKHRRILEAFSQGSKCVWIADKFGVNERTVRRIISRAKRLMLFTA